RAVRIVPVAESELELVVACARRLEGAAADVHDVPGFAGGVAVPRSIGMIRVVIDAAVLTRTAARREAIAPPVPCVLRVDEQVRSEHVIVLELVEAVQRVQEPGLRIKILLVPEKRIGGCSSLPGIATQLLLCPVEIEEGKLILARGRPVDLDVRVLEKR